MLFITHPLAFYFNQIFMRHLDYCPLPQWINGGGLWESLTCNCYYFIFFISDSKTSLRESKLLAPLSDQVGVTTQYKPPHQQKMKPLTWSFKKIKSSE